MDLPPAYCLLHKLRTTSTMDDARDALRTGAGHGTVCTAGGQTRGRGRVAGREWSDDGTGDLLFTLILHRPAVRSAYPLTQLSALALCRYLEDYWDLETRIKWPNDVFVGGGKIAGILVETEQDFFLVGMGVNIVERRFPAGFRSPAMSLHQAIGPDRVNGRPKPASLDVLSGLTGELDRLLENPPPVSEVQRRLSGLGENVRMVLGDPGRSQEVTGRILGLGPDGALRLETVNGQPLEVYSGEITGDTG